VMGALVSVSLTLATVPVMEIETGFIDLVLAWPVARHWIVTRSHFAGADLYRLFAHHDGHRHVDWSE
jgi:hypothetical protein